LNPEHIIYIYIYIYAVNVLYLNTNLFPERCEDWSVLSSLWILMETSEQVHALTGLPV